MLTLVRKPLLIAVVAALAAGCASHERVEYAKAEQSWVGPAGATGATGATGEQGATGNRGEPGMAVSGPAGPRGEVGPAGAQGPAGPTGAQGKMVMGRAGDTGPTMDMQIVGDLYQPEVAVLPIGDHYTMGPREAAYATRLIRPRWVVPCHYGTFPVLTGTPDALRNELEKLGVTVEVVVPKPGETLR